MPSYAVPAEDVRADILEGPPARPAPARVLHPGIPFAAHSCDEEIVGHPRNPYHRVDVRRSSRHVRVELDGEVLAETTRPTLVFETSLPVRFYLPREDVRAEAHPSDRRTYCAYKGEASYSSFEVGGRRHEHLAWSYERPLPDAAELARLIAFWNERVDLVVDGERTSRPETVFTAALADEART